MPFSLALLPGLELSPGGLVTLFLEPELVLSMFKQFFSAPLLLLLELDLDNPGCQLFFSDFVRLRSCHSASSTETDTQILKGGC